MAREGVGVSENLTAAVIKRPLKMTLQLVIYDDVDHKATVSKTLAEFDGAAPIAETQELMAKIEEAAAAIAAGKKVTIEEKNNG